MTSELSARVTLQDNLHFVGNDTAGYRVDMDATTAAGGGKGLTPMELVLLGLAGCSAMDVIEILRKKRQPAEGMEVEVKGWRSDDHPTVFTTIELKFIVYGADVDPQAVKRAIELSRQRYCPVWAMLDKSVQIDAFFSIVRESPELIPVLAN